MTTFNSINSINNSVNNNVHFYTINGVKVFLADESDMQGVEPYRKNYFTDVNAYRIEDYRVSAEVRETYYESYGGSYDDGLEICIADVVNAENEQYVTDAQWICVDELEEVNEELHKRGFQENDIPNELLSEKDEEVLQTIKDYELAMSNTDVDYQFSRRITLDGDATLYLFQFGDIKSSAISYADGTTFVLDDWQGSRPESEEEIEDYNWVSAADGRKAIVMDGLPRLF